MGVEDLAVTIRQIAAVAGVSRGTVDRVLHNRPGVNAEIAQHVRRIADDLGFEPNRAGKILAARKQPIKIGCFLPSIGNVFFEEVIAGFRAAEAEYSDFGVSVEVVELQGFDASEHIAAIRGLVSRGCAALCVSAVDLLEVRAFVDQIVDSGIPIVTVNTDLTKTKRLCYVGTDYLQNGSTAAGLLALAGPEKLEMLIVTGSLKIRGHNERIQGFSHTLRKKKLRYRLVDIFESLDNDEHAYQMTLEALRTHPEINCIYITAAGVAGVGRAIVELGLRGRVRILCHDEIDATKQMMRDGVIDYAITQEPFEQGVSAIEILFNYFMNDRRSHPANHITKTVVKIKENL